MNPYMPLKRTLGFWELTLMGVGIIVGAGIYVLVGIAGVQAGSALWVSFLLAGIIAGLMALDYAELTSMLPKAGSTYYFTKEAFRSKPFAFIMGWITLATLVVSSAVVALGFGTYFKLLFPGISIATAAGGLIVFLAAINFFGVKYASGLNILFTILEVAGLVAIILFGFGILNPSYSLPELSFESSGGIQGILGASILAFFAYLGFETLANEAEEAKKVRKTLPKAILTAIVICIILYVATALAFTNIMSLDDITAAAQNKLGPLAVAGGKAGGALLLGALGIIALFSTANTVLIMMLGASRMIYGLAEDSALPKLFLKTSRFETPHFAIIFAALLSILIAFTGELKFIAEITVMGMFVVFFVDNASVVMLRKKEPKAERGFRIPFNIRGIPFSTVILGFALVGIAANEFYKNNALLYGVLAIIILGFVAYYAERLIAQPKPETKKRK
ncbi:MAG: APC family permease [Candidatus Micrarchaeota archaeon]